MQIRYGIMGLMGPKRVSACQECHSDVIKTSRSIQDISYLIQAETYTVKFIGIYVLHV